MKKRSRPGSSFQAVDALTGLLVGGLVLGLVGLWLYWLLGTWLGGLVSWGGRPDM